MPPRHAYWTILIDNQPTAFRAHDPEELLPTLNRLREKNESAVMKWYERGKLFDSRDAAREEGYGKGERRWEGPRPGDRENDREPGRRARDDRPTRDDGRESRRPPREDGAGPRRDKTWRPGGEHRDPRQKYKDAKKAKWTRFKQKVRERHEERLERDPERFTPPHGDKLGGATRAPRPKGPAGWQEDRDGRPSRPHGDKYRDERPRAPRESRGPRDDWRDRDRRPARPRDDRFGSGDRDRSDWRDRDRDRGDSRERDRGDWRDRPPRRDDGRGDASRPARTGGRDSEGRFGDRGDNRSAGGRAPNGPRGDRPFGGKGAGARKPWGAKPGGFPRKPSGGSFRNRRPPGRRRDDDE